MSARANPYEPFDSAVHRRRADVFGLYVFLASEVMLFGGLFVAMAVDRVLHPSAAAEASARFDLWLGAANTFVLLTSSLAVALATVWARAGRARLTAAGLLAAATLGLAFLAIKGLEYRREYLEGLMPAIGPPSPFRARPPSLFVGLYFVSTALHAVHVTAGVGLLAFTGVRIGQRRLSAPQGAETVELVGLYWHMVDIIWLFLFPLLYLARP